MATPRASRPPGYLKTKELFLVGAFGEGFAAKGLGLEFAGKEAFEGVEVEAFHLAEGLHPDRGFAQRVGFEFAPLYAAALFLADEFGGGEHAEVFGDRCQRHFEGFGNVRDGHIILKQHREDGAPCGVGEGGEDGVKLRCHKGDVRQLGRNVNQMVEYRKSDFRMRKGLNYRFASTSSI